MWYDLCLFIVGGLLAIVELVRRYPLKSLGKQTVLSIFLVLASASLSVTSGVFNVFELQRENSAWAWVAIVFCAIFFIANVGMSAYILVKYFNRGYIEKWCDIESALSFEECLTHGNTKRLQKVQIIFVSNL
jgi:hypothetical protein